MVAGPAAPDRIEGGVGFLGWSNGWRTRPVGIRISLKDDGDPALPEEGSEGTLYPNTTGDTRANQGRGHGVSRLHPPASVEQSRRPVRGHWTEIMVGSCVRSSASADVGLPRGGV